MNSTEAMRKALSALEIAHSHSILDCSPEIAGLRAALAQAEQRQEAPAWRGLTEAERLEILKTSGLDSVLYCTECALRAKNAAPQPEEPKQHAPGLCLESGEFIPAKELNKARNKE